MTTECQRTAPERIYLNIFSETDAPFPDDHEGITWCESEVGDIDPSYVRSDIAAAEIARLQARLAESLQQSDALLARGLEYCDKIDALQAQVDAFAEALRKVSVIGNEDGLSRDEYQQRLIAAAGYARVALAAVCR